MSDALLVLMSVGIVFLIGLVEVVLTAYTWTLLKNIRSLLEANVYLNTEAIDLIRYGKSRGYEQGRADALRSIARRGANLGEPNSTEQPE